MTAKSRQNDWHGNVPVEFDAEMAAPVPKIKNAKRPLGWRQLPLECEWKHGESAVVKYREGCQEGLPLVGEEDTSVRRQKSKPS